MTWQLARVLRATYMPECIGKVVWTNPARREPCGVAGCTVPSILVNLSWSRFDDDDDEFFDSVMHLDALEHLPVFASDVAIISGRNWLTMIEDEVRALGGLS